MFVPTGAPVLLVSDGQVLPRIWKEVQIHRQLREGPQPDVVHRAEQGGGRIASNRSRPSYCDSVFSPASRSQINIHRAFP